MAIRLLSLPILMVLIAHHELSICIFFYFVAKSRSKECDFVCSVAQSFRQESELSAHYSDLFKQKWPQKMIWRQNFCSRCPSWSSWLPIMSFRMAYFLFLRAIGSSGFRFESHEFAYLRRQMPIESQRLRDCRRKIACFLLVFRLFGWF